MAAAVTAGRRYAGRTAGERRTERRERLIEAAVALYGSRGYRATPVLDVCRSAKVTPRHFYDLFGDAEALLLAAYDRVMHEQMAAIVEALEGAPDDLEGRLRAGVAAAATLLRDERHGRLAQQEVLGVSARVDRRYNEAMEALAGLLAAEAASFLPERSAAELELASVFAVGGLNHAFYSWRVAPKGERRELAEFADELAGVTLAALGAR